MTSRFRRTATWLLVDTRHVVAGVLAAVLPWAIAHYFASPHTAYLWCARILYAIGSILALRGILQNVQLFAGLGWGVRGPLQRFKAWCQRATWLTPKRQVHISGTVTATFPEGIVSARGAVGEPSLIDRVLELERSTTDIRDNQTIDRQRIDWLTAQLGVNQGESAKALAELRAKLVSAVAGAADDQALGIWLLAVGGMVSTC